VRRRTENTVPMRLRRMNQILDVCDEAPLGTQMWSKFAAPQYRGLFLQFQTHSGEAKCGIGTEKAPHLVRL
jgi:hypothetical protein